MCGTLNSVPFYRFNSGECAVWAPLFHPLDVQVHVVYVEGAFSVNERNFCGRVWATVAFYKTWKYFGNFFSLPLCLFTSLPLSLSFFLSVYFFTQSHSIASEHYDFLVYSVHVKQASIAYEMQKANREFQPFSKAKTFSTAFFTTS